MGVGANSFVDYLFDGFFELGVVEAISILTDGDFFEDDVIDVKDFS